MHMQTSDASLAYSGVATCSLDNYVCGTKVFARAATAMHANNVAVVSTETFALRTACATCLR